MKKLITVILSVMVLFSLLMAGCAGNGTAPVSSSTPEASSPAALSPAATESTAPASPSDTAVPAAKPLKVALLLSGNLGDMSFLDSSNAGMQAVAAKNGTEVKVIEMGSDSSKYETNVLDASESDYDVIIGSGWMLQEPIENVAANYPDKKYILFDASVDYTKADYSNVYSINYKQNEASFLAGMLAAKMSKTGKLGFLGGMDGAVINDFLIGYIEGAKYVNPDIKISAAYIGSYVDSAKCKEMAIAQYNQNIDIIFTAAGAAGLGTLDAAKELGKYAIGVDSDQAMIFDSSDPDKAKQIPTSVMKRVDNSLVRAFDMISAGTLKWGGAETLGLAEDAVGLSDNKYYQSIVPADVRSEIDTARSKIISGDIKVSTAFGKETSEITQIIDSVKP